MSSYRLDNGVLHNPVNDRRTTQGVFHVAEGGLPIPADKTRVPLVAYLRLLQEALRPPARPHAPAVHRELAASRWRRMVSLLLRPLVCPAVPKVSPEKRMEVRFFAPGGLVSNLDFVESIFGNAGDPYLPGNDAALDVDHWTGHSGCVILAPHLTRLRKKDLGLPHVSRATDAQRAAGMCWANESELYNNGSPFKVTSRGIDGVMVTILADNYFGYCKKEVKTQIGYSANLFGLAEEEHAGGALAFATFNLGDRFLPDLVRIVSANHRLAEVLGLLGVRAQVPRHRATRPTRSIPRSTTCRRTWRSTSTRQDIKWVSDGQEQHLKLLPGRIYIHPSGYKIRMAKHRAAPSWRLIGTVPEGAFCHKPCTVSGGGKSEISKSLVDAVLPGSFYVRSFEDDMALVQEIFDRDYEDVRLPEPRASDGRGPSRPFLSPDRSLGSVIKLLTPNPAEFTPEYNAWLESIPNHVRALVFVIKRFYRPEWGDDWRAPFQRRHHQRRTRARAQVRGAAAGRQLSAHRARGERRVADLQAAAGLRRRRQGADGGRHHRLGGGPGAPAGRAPGRVRRPPEPQAGAELRVPALPAARRRDPSGPRPADRGGHGGARALLLEFSAAHPGGRAAASSRTWRCTTPSPSRCASTWPGTRRAPTAATRSARPSRGWSAASRTKNPRYLQVRPDLARPARPVRRGDGRQAQPPAAACTRRCCSR